MRIFALLPMLFLFFSCSNPAESNKVNLEERIARIENGLQPNLQIKNPNGDTVPKFNIEARLKERGIPGVSIAVLNNGEVEWAKGYGMADVGENR